MKIRPKKVLYAASGVKFSAENVGGKNWLNIFRGYRQHILDQLSKYGEANDYGEWLNEMQRRHASLYNKAAASGDWESIAYEDPEVGNYQHDYKGDQRFGQIQLNQEDKYDFNQSGIKPNQDSRYNIINPPSRTSGDYFRDDYNYNVDNYYSAITDDRRLLGRIGDWDKTSEEYKNWIKDLNARGWTMELDPSDHYYKLKRLQNPETSAPTQQSGFQLAGKHKESKKLDWQSLQDGLRRHLPDILGATRLGLTLASNKKIYDEIKKGLSPGLQDTYNTHSQIVGDEATRQGYYRRAAQGQTQAAQPVTSDSDRQMAYQMEAKRIGDELRAQGDLVDNQEIRRTSELSNQHQYANAQRATDVANQNKISLAKYNQQLHQLEAERAAANHTSWNNFLLEKETRLNQAKNEQKALENQLLSLDWQDQLINNPELQAASDRMQDAYDKAIENNTDANGNVDYTKASRDPKFIEAKKVVTTLKNNLQRQQIRELINRTYFAKNGTKIQYKKKDDLLYKTAKDAVEHFRKMTALTDISAHRSRTKKIKLIPHPKRMQTGGVAPFVVYTPAPLGGESAISSQSTSDSTNAKSAKSSSKDSVDIIKELFKDVEGLPSDVNGVYQSMLGFFAQSKAFGTEIDPEDLAGIYLQQLQKINNIKFSKANYDAALKHATEMDALDEYAVTDDGKFIVQDVTTGDISSKTWEEVKGSNNLNPLTNNMLLNMRAYDKNWMLGRGDSALLTIVNKGIGISKIAEFIKQNIPSLGKNEKTFEGYTKKQAGQIRQGFEQLLQDAPDGVYEWQEKSSDQKEQINMALEYILSILPKNMRAILEARADQSGVSVPDMISKMLSAKKNTAYELTIKGSASGTASNGTSSKGRSGGTDTPAVVSFLLGQGYQDTITYTTGNSQGVKVKGRFGILQDNNHNIIGQGHTVQDVSNSSFGPILELDKATFGGQRLNTTGFNHIILNNADCIGMDLPVKLNRDGNFVPDFQQLKEVEKAEEEIYNNNIKDIAQINAVYRKYNLPEKYDSQGNLIQRNYRRFAALNVIMDSKALKDNEVINSDEVQEASDAERELFIESMKKQGLKDYDLSNGYLWGAFGEDKLYKGTIFAPIREDYVAGFISGGQPLDTNLPNDATMVAEMQHAPKISQYKQVPTLSQLQNK